MSDIHISRRQLLIAGGLALGACALPGTAIATPFKAKDPRTISLCNIHTGENLETEYYNGRGYIYSELKRMNHLCRDFRQNEATRMDKRLFDTIAHIQDVLGHKGQAQIISGYRSPATNKMLARHSGGVAKKSYHMTGQAIDFNLEGIPLSKVRRAAMELNIGGVGYYPKSGFVHIDTGPVRQWRG
ncbi:DUF882 domain-containing protein [Photobacterium damselae]